MLDYGSWAATLSRDDVIDIATKHLDQPFEAAFAEVFGTAPPDELNGDLSLTIVAAELDDSSERIVTYLRGFGVPVNAVFFSYLEDDGRRYLARSWLATSDEDAPVAKVVSTKAKRAPWNGRDWYVNSGSHGREWADGLEFGFVSAGGGPAYSDRLRPIAVGDRLNVYVPGRGYVGVGVTLAEARPFRVAQVQQASRWIPLAGLPLRGNYRHAAPAHEESDEMADWVIPVRWLATASLEDAFTEAGLFSNPNAACKLRQDFTLERLADHFGVADD